MAGKAHPADDGGKKLIQAIVQLSDDPEVRHRIAYLPNYDIAMAQPLYPGCDVWLNNPLRPYEACGTSGMKAALNGGLNLSILDGWWDEWYDGENGWAIPSADGVVDPDHRDDLEANALYDLIENEVAPRFYDVDAEGVPTRWLEMTRHTLKSLGPKVLATRMVRDYVRQLYTPAATTARELNSDYAGAASLAAWKKRVRAGWSGVRVEHVESSGVGDAPEVGDDDERAGLRRARRAHARATSTSSSCTAAAPARTSWSTPRWSRSPWRSPTRADGTASTAASPSTTAAPSATPSASSPATTCSPRPPSSGSSPCPEGRACPDHDLAEDDDRAVAEGESGRRP